MDMNEKDLLHIWKTRDRRDGRGCLLATTILRIVDPQARSHCETNCPFSRCIDEVSDDYGETLKAMINEAIERVKNERQ